MTPSMAEPNLSSVDERGESAAATGRGLAAQAAPATAIPTASRSGEVPTAAIPSSHRRLPDISRDC